MSDTNRELIRNHKGYDSLWYKAQAYLGHYSEIPNPSWSGFLNQDQLSHLLQLPQLFTTVTLTQDSLAILATTNKKIGDKFRDKSHFEISKGQSLSVQHQAIAGILAILKLQVRALQRWSYINPKQILGAIKPQLYDRNVQIQDHISALSILQQALRLKKHGVLP